MLLVPSDLQVDRNLNVNGNLTIGGTSACVSYSNFKVADADLVLGVRTDAGGNDVSNDTTANHGGIRCCINRRYSFNKSYWCW